MGSKKRRFDAPDLPPIEPGQYWAASYRGDNGDLIVGIVMEVRRKHTILLNLLSRRFSRKLSRNLRRRNKIIREDQAVEIVSVYHKTKSKAETREWAVSTPSHANRAASRSEEELMSKNQDGNREGQHWAVNSLKALEKLHKLGYYNKEDGLTVLVTSCKKEGVKVTPYRDFDGNLKDFKSTESRTISYDVFIKNFHKIKNHVRRKIVRLTKEKKEKEAHNLAFKSTDFVPVKRPTKEQREARIKEAKKVEAKEAAREMEQTSLPISTLTKSISDLPDEDNESESLRKIASIRMKDAADGCKASSELINQSAMELVAEIGRFKKLNNALAHEVSQAKKLNSGFAEQLTRTTKLNDEHEKLKIGLAEQLDREKGLNDKREKLNDRFTKSVEGQEKELLKMSSLNEENAFMIKEGWPAKNEKIGRVMRPSSMDKGELNGTRRG